MTNEKAIKVLIKMADDFQIPTESERGQAIEKALFELAKGKKEGTIEELETIKSKIKSVQFGDIPYVDKCKILEIIENRISELNKQ